MKRFLTAILMVCLLSGQVPPVMRLHVRANSNSEEDQAVKLLVRDAIILQLGDMDGARTYGQAQAYIEAHLDNLIQTANQVLRENGETYTASATIGTAQFPEKMYGDVCFPAGTYNALRMNLGTGEGENWWCVLFPPLCLVEPIEVDPDWQQSEGVTYDSWLQQLFS